MKTITKKSLSTALACILCANPAFAESAEDAWKSLLGQKDAAAPEFAFVKNDPALPNILIYGDSISIGYTQRVRANLKGKANVYRIHCNGGDTARVIPNMKKMQDTMAGHWSFKWDVIHFNSGLHDLKYLGKDGKYDVANGTQVHSPEAYAENLKGIFAYFKGIAPDAKIIFATTTPVPEKSQGRVAGDSEKFNKAALDVVRGDPGITVNDLFAFTKPKHAKWWVSPGNVHYNKIGCNAQGDEVTRIIRESLSPK